MIIQEHISLQPYNTFGVDAKTSYFIDIKKTSALIELCKSGFLNNKKCFVLGSGSNTLFTENFSGVIIKNSIQGIVFKQEGTLIQVVAGAGVNWHELVLKSLKKNAYGLENLSLIPGTVGAAPIQNIGAYGVELKDVFQQLKAVEIKTGELKCFTKEQCDFSYRSSIFKTDLKNKYSITEVTLALNSTPKVNTHYSILNTKLKEKGIIKPSPQEVSKTVITIRESKLPNPIKLGNAGSFFKNPIISESCYIKLSKIYNDIPSFPQKNNTVKIPAAWLIEQAGWKGKVVGKVGVSPLQPLVLVNYDGGTGKEIKALAGAIQKSILKKFKIKLVFEVTIL